MLLTIPQRTGRSPQPRMSGPPMSAVSPEEGVRHPRSPGESRVHPAGRAGRISVVRMSLPATSDSGYCSAISVSTLDYSFTSDSRPGMSLPSSRKSNGPPRDSRGHPRLEGGQSLACRLWAGHVVPLMPWHPSVPLRPVWSRAEAALDTPSRKGSPLSPAPRTSGAPGRCSLCSEGQWTATARHCPH